MMPNLLLALPQTIVAVEVSLIINYMRALIICARDVPLFVRMVGQGAQRSVFHGALLHVGHGAEGEVVDRGVALADRLVVYDGEVSLVAYPCKDSPPAESVLTRILEWP